MKREGHLGGSDGSDPKESAFGSGHDNMVLALSPVLLGSTLRKEFLFPLPLSLPQLVHMLSLK